MSVFLFEKEYCLLEPCEGKLSRTVLRGESTRKGADLPDIFTCGKSNHRVTGIYIRFTCFVAQILSVFGTHDSKLNFHKILTLIS